MLLCLSWSRCGSLCYQCVTYFACIFFFLSSRRRHTRCALVTGVQTCALPICFLLLSLPQDSRVAGRGANMTPRQGGQFGRGLIRFFKLGGQDRKSDV